MYLLSIPLNNLVPLKKRSFLPEIYTFDYKNLRIADFAFIVQATQVYSHQPIHVIK